MSEPADRDMTEGERLLWRMLRTRKFGSAKFKRDVTVGPFRVAFACETVPVIVEVDDSATTGVPRDPERDQWLFCHGYRVLLFRAADVAASPDGILSIIETEVQAAPRRTSRTVVPLRDGEGA
ncbi:endonuclease domain-containing protein [Rhodoplanes azumiensis]|uniref:Endonuclease domain-containing protein n=1 Tax=Rhodoplanes azumiensis TaxID=1897628 RepID=A0ABW5AG91_9BRAD